MPGLRGRDVGWVPCGTPSDTAWTGKVPPMVGRLTTTIVVHVLLTKDGRVSGFPVQGLQGGGLNQPLDSLCTLPYAGCDSDSGGFKPSPHLLPLNGKATDPTILCK